MRPLGRFFFLAKLWVFRYNEKLLITFVHKLLSSIVCKYKYVVNMLTRKAKFTILKMHQILTFDIDKDYIRIIKR